MLPFEHNCLRRPLKRKAEIETYGTLVQSSNAKKRSQRNRSFNPDEFTIALEQVVTGTALRDYEDPVEFFKRTCFTRALHEHTGMVLRRLSGKTENTAPVLTLITHLAAARLTP